MSLLTKLLSHRLRGFGAPENSQAAMEAACAAGIPYLEIDTRVADDRTIYVSHDPRTDAVSDAPGSGASDASRDRLTPAKSGAMFELQDALRIFSSRSQAQQRLCIDIKDYGWEEAHLDLVRAAGVEQRVCFISWIPQTILRLHALGTKSPLILSYFELGRFGAVGRVADRIFRNRCIRIGSWVLMGDGRYGDASGENVCGFNYGLCSSGLPSGLVRVLRESGGGICVQRHLVSQALIRRCEEQGLQLWTFSVRSLSQFLHDAQQPGIDVVFCDEAGGVVRGLGRE